MKRMRRIASLGLLIMLMLAVWAMPAAAQSIPASIAVDCPGGGSINNGVAVGVNVRPGTYRITALGIDGFDPVLAIYETASESTLNCVDDAPAAASYSALLPTTGVIVPSPLNAQLILNYPGSDFGNYFAVVGGLGDTTGEAVIVFEELAVTSADGSGALAGDPYYINITQNMINSGIPVTTYMISLTNVLDPYISLVEDDTVIVTCDDAGNPARCFNDVGTLLSAFIGYTAPNNEVLVLGGYQFDAALSLDPAELAAEGITIADVRLSSFNQNTVGDYIAAFHVGIGLPDGATTTGTTGTTTTGTTGSLTGAATTGTTTTGSLTGAAGSQTGTTDLASLPTFSATCTDNAQATRLASLTVGQSVLVTCPAACTSGAIWGTGTYTDDSAVCTAAIHAGALTADGGSFVLSITPGQQTYTGSVTNRITSGSWGAWQRSFSPLPADASVIPTGEIAAAAPTQGAVSSGGPTLSREGSLEPGETGDIYRFLGEAGDVVTITMQSVPAGAFDTRLNLRADGSDLIIATNDDHGEEDPALARFDSRIRSFTLPTFGLYFIEATRFGGAASGDYILELAVESSSAPGAYVLETIDEPSSIPSTLAPTPTTSSLSAAGQATPVPLPTVAPLTLPTLAPITVPTMPPLNFPTVAPLPTLVLPTPLVGSAAFVAPSFGDATYTTPDGIPFALPVGWLAGEAETGTVFANSAAALAAALITPQADFALLPADGLVIQVLPQSLTEGMAGATPLDVIESITSGGNPVAIEGIGSRAAFTTLTEDVPPGINGRMYAFVQDDVLIIAVTADRLANPDDPAFGAFLADFFNTAGEGGQAAVPINDQLFVPPALVNEEVYSPLDEFIPLGTDYGVGLPAGWVYETFTNRVMMSNNAEVLARVIQANGRPPVLFDPDQIVIIVFTPSFASDIGGDEAQIEQIERFGTEMGSVVPVSRLGTGEAISGLVGTEDQPVGGRSFITVFQNGEQRLVVTTMTSYSPPLIVRQVRDVISSIRPAEDTPPPTPVSGLSGAFTAELSTGETLTMTLPAGWLARETGIGGMVTAGNSEAALDAFSGGDMSDTEPNTIALQVVLPMAIEELLGVTPPTLEETMIQVAQSLDAIGVPRPLEGLPFPAVIANFIITDPNSAPNLRVIVFETPAGFMLAGFSANGDADAALAQIIDIVSTIEVTSGE